MSARGGDSTLRAQCDTLRFYDFHQMVWLKLESRKVTNPLMQPSVESASDFLAAPLYWNLLKAAPSASKKSISFVRAPALAQLRLRLLSLLVLVWRKLTASRFGHPFHASSCDLLAHPCSNISSSTSGTENTASRLDIDTVDGPFVYKRN